MPICFVNISEDNINMFLNNIWKAGTTECFMPFYLINDIKLSKLLPINCHLINGLFQFYIASQYISNLLSLITCLEVFWFIWNCVIYTEIKILGIIDNVGFYLFLSPDLPAVVGFLTPQCWNFLLVTRRSKGCICS